MCNSIAWKIGATFLMFSGALAFADSSSGTVSDLQHQFDAEMVNYNNDYNTQNQVVHDLQMALDNAKGEVESFTVDMNLLMQKDYSQRGGVLGFAQGMSQETTLKQIHDLQAKIDEKTKAVDVAQKNFDTANAPYQDLLKKIGATKNSYGSQIATAQNNIQLLQKSLQMRDLGYAFDKLQVQGLKMSDVLRQIEARYDNSILGAYTDQKLARLLGSDALCSAAASCSGGKNKFKPKSSDMSQIFSGKPGYLLMPAVSGPSSPAANGNAAAPAP